MLTGSHVWALLLGLVVGIALARGQVAGRQARAKTTGTAGQPLADREGPVSRGPCLPTLQPELTACWEANHATMHLMYEVVMRDRACARFLDLGVHR